MHKISPITKNNANSNFDGGEGIRSPRARVEPRLRKHCI
jgi:hypothetical protein